MNRLWQRQVKMIDVVLQNTIHHNYSQNRSVLSIVPFFSPKRRAKTSQPMLMGRVAVKQRQNILCRYLLSRRCATFNHLNELLQPIRPCRHLCLKNNHTHTHTLPRPLESGIENRNENKIYFSLLAHCCWSGGIRVWWWLTINSEQSEMTPNKPFYKHSSSHSAVACCGCMES